MVWRSESDRRSLEELGVRVVSSKYFDQAMQYKGTRFTALPFKRLFEDFSKDELGEVDSVLLNCFDDYQGLISIEDIKRYKLNWQRVFTCLPEYDPRAG